MTTLYSTDSASFPAERGELLRPLLLILFTVSVLRAALLSLSSLDLFVDEIQYWWWSTELDWGFYSKPPMVAVLIKLVTSLFGHSVFAIKLGALLVYPLSTFVIYLLGRRLISERVGFWAAVLFITLPGVALSSTITSTDVLLFLFWGTAMLTFLRSVETNLWRDWLICGVICGLGLLTKYNMAIFAISATFYLIGFGHRQMLTNPRLWMMAAIALLIMSPNIYWNYLNDFPTFAHTAEYVDQKGLYPGRMLSFLLEQAGVIGPVGLIILCWWMLKGKSPRNLLLTFGLPMLAIISLVALQGKYNANWAAPAYVAFIIGIAHFLQDKRKWLIAMLVSNIALSLLIQLAEPVVRIAHIELPAKADPFRRVHGWKAWGDQLQGYLKQYPDYGLLTDGRAEITEAAYYGYGMPNEKMRAWAPGPQIRSHFQLTRPLTQADSGPMLYLTRKSRDELAPYFTQVDLLGSITRTEHVDRIRSYQLYLVQGFKGYE
jgi:hypothetical protein